MLLTYGSIENSYKFKNAAYLTVHLCLWIRINNFTVTCINYDHMLPTLTLDNYNTKNIFINNLICIFSLALFIWLSLTFLLFTFGIFVFVTHTADEHLPRAQAVSGVGGSQVCLLVQLPGLNALKNTKHVDI